MLCLVNDITDLFQIQNGTFKIKLIPVNLKIAINDLYNIVSLQAAEKKIAIDIIINKQIEKEIFLLDGMRISSILQNLVMNAIKFSPEGGKIQIKAELDESKENQMSISVSDTGIGMTNEVKQSLFTIFRAIT